MVSLDFITISIAAIVGLLFQILWYSPIFFGKIWLRLQNISKTENIVGKFFASFITLFVMSFFLALMQRYLDVTSFWDGVISGVIIWLGFLLPLDVFSIIWGKKHFKVLLIDTSCWLCVFLLMGAILAG